MIKCICCFFNYNNNQVIKKNYINFRKKLMYSVTTIEISLKKENFFIEDSIKILANERNALWQKERCFNIALEHLDNKYDKIVWLDTDIIFHNINWIYDLEKKLDDFCFVQPFESVFEKKGNNKRLNCESYAKKIHDKIFLGKKIKEEFALGLTWGIRRDALEPYGFFDKHILGANDNLQVCFYTGDYHNSYILRLPTRLKEDYVRYLSGMKNYKNKSIGYCKGAIEHLYHGDIKERGYAEREVLLLKENFDPSNLKIGSNGLYELDNKDMLKKIKTYFLDRHKKTREG